MLYYVEQIELLVVYVHQHRYKLVPMIDKPLISNNLNDHTCCKFDVWFADLCDTKKDQLSHMMCLANNVGMIPLLHLLCAKTASKFKGVPFASVKRKLDELTITSTEKQFQCSCSYH